MVTQSGSMSESQQWPWDRSVGLALREIERFNMPSPVMNVHDGVRPFVFGRPGIPNFATALGFA